MAGAQKDRHLRDSPSSSGSSSASSARGSSSVRSGASKVRTDRSPVSVRSTRGGFDGNVDPGVPALRNPATARPIVDPRNFDLGMAGWATVRSSDITGSLPSRQAPSKLGSAVKIGLNSYMVEQLPSIDVYQYDVLVGNGIEKRGLIKKVMESKTIQDQVGNGFIFDGNKLGWSGTKLDREIKTTLDMNVENGRKNPKKDDTVRVVIRCTNKIGFTTLAAHLQGKVPFDNVCLEAINFLDHLLRQTPSARYTAIKRCFFAPGQQRFHLGGNVEAYKGVFATLRVVHPGRLAVNVDVANGTFWTCQAFHHAAVQVCGARGESDLVVILAKGEKHRAGVELKKLRKLHVLAAHRGLPAPDSYVIERFIYGVDAKTYKVQVTDPQGKEVEMSISEFFHKKYNIRINYPGLPLVKMTRGKNTVLPMEVLIIKENQRCSFKMDERQTSLMIKFAVTAPPDRAMDIKHGLAMLDWPNDPVLSKYGMKISTQQTKVEGRLLPAPTVKFGGVGEAKPGTSGKWDLKGKKFLQVNPVELKSWAVCVVTGRRGGKPDKTTVDTFIKSFVNAYIAHGGKVSNKNPAMTLASGEDAAQWVTAAWNHAGNQSNARPQILFFMLPDKDATSYGRIKRSCECRYGVVSQCVQYGQVAKNHPQYISNVCMKFNAKLGGATCRAVGAKTANGHFTVPTMVIGADVSHAAPGAQVPSMAAITVSIDKLATRYAAVCQTNGFRVEMIKPETISTDLKPLVLYWMSNVGAGKAPATIVYMRDGVSEGQYQHVLQQEVADLKTLVGSLGGTNTKFIVVVGGKRHHVRFFPEKGDRNGNAHPGTLIESGVTQPFENDFYLQAHAAIKGTARPVHYHVLANEPNMPNDQLMTMLYEHSYQYARASTPISQHPAIYYAHLASNRAVPHDPKWVGSTDANKTSSTRPPSGSQSGSGSGSQGKKTGSSSGAPPGDFDKLLPMPNQGNINASMWYI